MIESILEVLGAGLSLWNSKEKTKYLDKLLALEKLYYVESNKQEHIRSDAVLDNLSFELRTLGLAFSSEIRKQNTAVKS